MRRFTRECSRPNLQHVATASRAPQPAAQGTAAQSSVDFTTWVQDCLAQYGDSGAWPHLEKWLSENDVSGTITLAYEFDSAHEVYATDLPSLAQPALERLWLAAGTLATGKVRKATEAAVTIPVEFAH